MIKDATTWKAGLSAPATFWASLLVSSAVVNCLPLQAAAYQSGTPPAKGIAPLHVHEVPDPVATSSVPQEAASVGEHPVFANICPQNGILGLDKQSLPSQAEFKSAQADFVCVAATSVVRRFYKIGMHPSIKASAEAPSVGDVPSVADLSSNEADSDTNEPMSQITNVTQLRDVSPGDWAYEALRSLVERYGCIAGYPDGTFRGNRATSRYEFAAGLNACLQQHERLITSGTQGL